jgi:hypothetical protein
MFDPWLSAGPARHFDHCFDADHAFIEVENPISKAAKIDCVLGDVVPEAVDALLHEHDILKRSECVAH